MMEAAFFLAPVFDDAFDAVVATGPVPPAGAGPPVIRYVNPAFVRMTGWRPQDVIGRTIDAILPRPSERADVIDRLRHGTARMHLVVGGSPPGGPPCALDASIQPLAGGAGLLFVMRPPPDAGGTGSDGHDGVRTFADTVPAMIVHLGRDLRIAFANRQFRSWYRRDQSPQDGLALRDVVGPERYARVEPYLERARAGEAVDFDDVHDYPDGKRRYLRVSYRPKPGMPAPAEVFGFIFDVTEPETARHRADLANRAKSEFLASMSHELRTPLNAIIGFAQMIDSQVFGSVGHLKYAEYASDILASGHHLLDLISDLIDLERIEAGRMELNRTAVPLDAIADQALRIIRPRAEAKRLALVYRPDGELPRLWADERAVRQVLLNLLANAVKFTPAGGTVTLEAGREEGMALLRVADTGIGMRPEDLARIGRPFARFAEGTDAMHEGSGIGLHVTRTLVELHEGSIGFDSGPGRGMRVTVRLPAVTS